MSCELSNWSGKAYKIPRIKIEDCSDRDDLTSAGVYLLFGKDEGEPTYDGFVVFKNSKAAASIVNSMTTNFITYRQKLITEGVPVDKGEYFEFSDDYIFSSPQTAAVMMMGRNANGLTKQKNKDDKTLKEFELNEK